MSRSHSFHKVPPGFCGLDTGRDVRIYHRHLPHWRQDGATYFVTFRLADSLPADKREELKLLKEQWEEEAESLETEAERIAKFEENARMAFVKTEQWLDRGYGDCLLRSPKVRDCIVDALEFFDDKRYEIGCYVIMPNHVHLVIRPFIGNELENILQSRKSKITKAINALNQTQGTKLWQQESHDRIIRDGRHLWRCIQYIGRNGLKAKLPKCDFTKWIKPQWVDLGWGFDEVG